jgi:hypothetical protein
MPDLKSIPDETKWRLASQCVARLPALYEAVFRPVTGDSYDSLEQEIWSGLAGFSYDMVKTLRLPVRTADELAQSLIVVSTIMFGPDFKAENLGVGDDGSVIIVKRCPFRAEGGVGGSQPEQVFSRCMAFLLTSQKILNPKFNSRFVRAVCMGDRQCEFKIEAMKKPDPDIKTGS